METSARILGTERFETLNALIGITTSAASILWQRNGRYSSLSPSHFHRIVCQRFLNMIARWVEAKSLTSDDTLLSETDVESALSVAYVHAIAAHAGYNCGEPSGLDRDSVDIQVSAGGHMRPKIDIQLKSTVCLKPVGTNFSYPLKVKNYDDLRVETQTPRILVVLDLPRERDTWLQTSIDQLVIQRCAYWVSLRGLPATSNSASVNILIPQANAFDVATLVRLMEQSRQGRVE